MMSTVAVLLHPGITFSNPITLAKLQQLFSSGYGSLVALSIETEHIADEAVTADKLADLARGSILVGQTANNRPAALDAKGDAKILVGDGTDLNSVAVSGDVTIDNTGKVEIAGGVVGVTELYDIPRGSIIVGSVGGRPALYSAETEGNILIGDGTDVVSVPTSGDVTIDKTGAMTIQPGSVEGTMLAASAAIVKRATLSLSAAQVFSLNTVPLTVIPAPGAGKVIIPLHFMLILDYTAPVFSGGAGDLWFRYNGGVYCSQKIFNSWIVQSVDSVVYATATPFYATELSHGPQAAYQVCPANTAIELYCSSAFSAGGSAVRVVAWYFEEDTGL